MNQYYDQNPYGQGQALSTEKANALLRRVFTIMTFGLAVTGIVAWLFAGWLMSDVENIRLVFGGPVRWLVMLAPLAFVLVLTFGINKLSAPAAAGVFFGYSAVMGISLSAIFLLYTMSSIFTVFFITAGIFGAMAFLGATTKMDLTKMGSILMMALIGIILAGIVNWFMQSPALSYLISMGAVVIFTGLTAYDTQNILRIGAQVEDGETANKAAVIGALSLYLNFINLLLALLRLLGDRR